MAANGSQVRGNEGRLLLLCASPGHQAQYAGALIAQLPDIVLVGQPVMTSNIYSILQMECGHALRR